ncbi:MAG TPA: fumarylacetoacetate hydrolase family protein, partial [Alphaproteobacteria bacterium]|nr:fumarylacetoacetate hydrolase family protein [Alphaproteobacteria bacterium]
LPSFRKSVDSYAVLGPWLVTAEEVPDPDALDFELRVNGEVRQKSNTRHLDYDVRRLIEYASSFYTLLPGDIIMTGTPAGVGPVKPGDTMSVAMERIGAMTVRVRAA